jgi:Bacterial regulatory helix-turn-helix protein, lysR family
MSSPGLDPELLKAFLAIADQLSFTRAATSLNRTQSAVSLQIKRLETQLRTELFKRSTSNVALSTAGEGLVGYARCRGPTSGCTVRPLCRPRAGSSPITSARTWDRRGRGDNDGSVIPKPARPGISGGHD